MSRFHVIKRLLYEIRPTGSTRFIVETAFQPLVTLDL